jgi:hypothetical protein
MHMARKRLTQIALACAFGAGLSLSLSSAASAYVVCDSDGDDCWQTTDRVQFPGVTLSFHDDAWRDQHREDKKLRWHDTDNDHDWHHGYWSHGEWHTG